MAVGPGGQARNPHAILLPRPARPPAERPLSSVRYVKGASTYGGEMFADAEVSTVVVPGLSALLVRSLFQVSRHNWPASYFGMDDSGPLDPIVNRSMPRFVLWRLTPVFVGAATTAITLERLDSEPLLGCLIFWAIYVLLSFAVAGVRSSNIRRGDRSPSSNFLVQLVLAAAAALVTLLAYVLRTWMAPAVPPPEALLQAAWVAVIIAASAQLLSSGMEARRQGGDLVRRSRREVGDDLIKAVREAAVANNADPRIAEAVLLTENLQRPQWIRRLERGRGTLFGAGSYGVMQSTAQEPISDIESIRRVVTQHLRDSQLPSTVSSGVRSPNVWGVGASIGGVNRSANWNSVFREVLQELAPSTGVSNRYYVHVGSTHTSTSGGPMLAISELGFDQGLVVTLIEATPEVEFPIRASLLGPDGEVLETTTQERSDWTTKYLLFLRAHPSCVAIVVQASGPDLEGLKPACRFHLPLDWVRSL